MSEVELPQLPEDFRWKVSKSSLKGDLVISLQMSKMSKPYEDYRFEMQGSWIFKKEVKVFFIVPSHEVWVNVSSVAFTYDGDASIVSAAREVIDSWKRNAELDSKVGTYPPKTLGGK